MWLEIAGSNGAGKTTVLNMLAGNLSATAGEAFIGGFSTTSELDYVYKTLGVCPQVRPPSCHNTSPPTVAAALAV